MRVDLTCLVLAALVVTTTGRPPYPSPPNAPTESFLEVSSVRCGPTNLYCGSAPATSTPDPNEIHHQPLFGYSG